jgi:hypothetical protein
MFALGILPCQIPEFKTEIEKYGNFAEEGVHGF